MQEQINSGRKKEIYQRTKLNGFTAKELFRMEASVALYNENMQSELCNPIHELFTKDKWYKESELPKDMAYVPILGDYDSYWTVDNPIIWNLMEPSLRLASAFLENHTAYPWYLI